MSLEKINQLNQTDRSIGLRLQQISINARGGRREKNRSFTSPVTQEQIDEYRKSLEQPHEIPDPENPGHTIKVKYLRPDETVELEDYTPLEDEMNDDEIGQLNEDIKATAEGIYEAQTNMLPQMMEQRKETERLLNSTPEFLQREIWGTTMNVKNPRFTQLRNALEEIDIGIDTIKNAINDETEHFNELQTIKFRNDDNKKINQGEKSRISKINKEKIRGFQERLNELNRGAFSTEQQPNETEEEYLKRLDEIASTPYDDTALQSESQVFNIKKLKENLKKLIRDESKIESVVRNLEPQDIFQTNKIFNILKNKFLNVYGVNNPQVKDTTIIDFIKDALYFGKYGEKRERGDEIPDEETPVLESNITQFASEAIPAIISTPTTIENYFKYDLEQEDTALKITNEGIEENPFLYFKLLIVNGKKYILYSRDESGSLGTYTQIIFGNNKTDDRTINKICQYLGISYDLAGKVLGGKDTDTIFKFLKNKGLRILQEAYKEEQTIQLSRGKTKQESLFGLGLPEDIPEGLIKFGRIQIYLHKLYYKNMLSVRDKSGFNIPGLRTVHVSDKFVDIIMKYIKKQQVKKSDFDSLNATEQQLLNSILYVSGLSKEHYNTGDVEINRLKNRLELVQGEIEAGNNNEKNYKEMYDILMLLVSLNAVGINDARKHLKDIKKNYF